MYPRGMVPTEGIGKIIEHSVHVHKKLFPSDITDARPFRIPSVVRIIRIAGFRKPVPVPCSVFQDPQEHRFLIPAQCPDDIRFLRRTVNPSAACNFRIFIPVDNGPVFRFSRVAFSVPFHKGPSSSVIGVNQASLTGICAFAMGPGQYALLGVCLIRKKNTNIEGMDIHLVQPFFHGHNIYLVFGIGQMPCGSRAPSPQFMR